MIPAAKRPRPSPSERHRILRAEYFELLRNVKTAWRQIGPQLDQWKEFAAKLNLRCEYGGEIETFNNSDRVQIFKALQNKHKRLQSGGSRSPLLEYKQLGWVVKIFYVLNNERRIKSFDNKIGECLNAVYAAKLKVGPSVYGVVASTPPPKKNERPTLKLQILLCVQRGEVDEYFLSGPGQAQRPAAAVSLRELLARASHFMLLADLKGPNVVWVDRNGNFEARLIDMNPALTLSFSNQLSYECTVVYNCVMLLAFSVREEKEPNLPRTLVIEENVRQLYGPVAQLLRETLRGGTWQRACLKLQNTTEIPDYNPYERESQQYWFHTMLYYMKTLGTSRLWRFQRLPDNASKLQSLADQIAELYLGPETYTLDRRAARLVCPWVAVAYGRQAN